MDPNANEINEAAEARVLRLPRTASEQTQPAGGGHLARAVQRTGAAASRVAARFWGPRIDRHLDVEDRNGFTGREYLEAAERVAARERAAADDPDCALTAVVLFPAGPGRWAA